MCERYEKLLRQICLSTLHDTEKHLHALRSELVERRKVALELIADGCTASASEIISPLEQMINCLEYKRNIFLGKLRQEHIQNTVLEHLLAEITAYSKKALEAKLSSKQGVLTPRTEEELMLRGTVLSLFTALQKYHERFASKGTHDQTSVKRFDDDLALLPSPSSCTTFFTLLHLQDELSALLIRARVILSTH